MPNHPNRKRNRLSGYNYSQPGSYFVTINTKERGEIFGRIKNGEMELNQYGNIALRYIQEIPLHYQGVILDEYIVMPDHVHAIIIISHPVSGLETKIGSTSRMEPENRRENVDTEIAAGLPANSELPVHVIHVYVGTEQCSVPTYTGNTNTGNTNTGNTCTVNSVNTINTDTVSATNIMNPADSIMICNMDEIRRQRYGLLSKIIKSYMEIVVKTIRRQYNDYCFTWQRSFYDHIIRNERTLNIIREYIRRNPARWELKALRKESHR